MGIKECANTHLIYSSKSNEPLCGQPVLFSKMIKIFSINLDILHRIRIFIEPFYYSKMNKENLSPKNLGLQILDFSDANKTSDPKIVVENQISLKKPSSRRSINCTIFDIDLN